MFPNNAKVYNVVYQLGRYAGTRANGELLTYQEAKDLADSICQRGRPLPEIDWKAARVVILGYTVRP
jgi:hypothetical protein